VKIIHAARLLVLALSLAASPALRAATDSDTEAEAPTRSALDALLFYQLMLGEMELRGGQPAVAYEVVLDAARRTKDETLFRRAVEIALQGRAGDQALAAAKAWRLALPESNDALRLHLQILAAMNRAVDAAEPLRLLLDRTPMAERNGLIASMPRLFQRAGDPKATAQMIEQALAPHAAVPATSAAALVATGRAWLTAGEPERALALARQAAANDPQALGPALLALDLLPREPAAEAIVTARLQAPNADPALRLAYVRVLTQAQRYPDGIVQLEAVTRLQPENAQPWLSLGALHLELKQVAQAEQALQRYLQLADRRPKAALAATPANSDDNDGDENEADGGLVQAWMMLAQAAELRSDFKAAEAYLARVDSPQRALEVQTRRATLLARQGKVAQARELVRKVPESSPADGRAKLVAEAQVLREVKQWRDAYEVLALAGARFPDDHELIYEQAMMAEKLDRLADMERLLRRVIEIKPDHQHAYNALGYSLADRGQRLAEARDLIRKALELAPGDPFITDSLGWVEFRLGRHEEALRLLQQAYSIRPDTEIAAHLGEVMWVLGRRDDARRIWREGRSRDAANDVLRETLARIKPDL
jgi:tetratricopeptide (TPR) repeat protein